MLRLCHGLTRYCSTSGTGPLLSILDRCCKTAGQSGLLGRPGSKLLGGFGGLLGRSVPGISIAMLSIVLARHCSTPGAGPRHRSPRHYTDYTASARQSGLLNRPGSRLLGRWCLHRAMVDGAQLRQYRSQCFQIWWSGTSDPRGPAHAHDHPVTALITQGAPVKVGFLTGRGAGFLAGSSKLLGAQCRER